jgi:hypothetical protein
MTKKKKKKKGEERSITFKKPNAPNSQNLLKIGYQPKQIDKKTPRNCMPTIGNLPHTQQKSLANETEQKFTNFFIQKIYLSAITKTEISIEKKCSTTISSLPPPKSPKGITPQNIVPIPSIQFSPSQAKLTATKKQPKDKEKEKGTNITLDRL